MKKRYFIFTLIILSLAVHYSFGQCNVVIKSGGNIGPFSICAGKSITLVADTTPTAPGICTPANVTFSWAPTAGSNNSLTVSPASQTIYTVTITTSLGSTTTATAQVNVNANPTVSITGNAAKCANDPAITWSSSAVFSAYSWSTGAITSSISVSSAGTYTLTVTNGAGCSASATKSLTVNANPTVSITGNSAKCANDPAIIWSATSGFSSYSWSTGATTSNISVSTAGTYTVTVSNGTCTASATQSLTVNANPTVSITGNATKCASDPAISWSSSAVFTSYSWSTGAITSNISVSTAGTYTLTVTNGTGCSASATKSLTVSADPNVSITGNATKGANDPALIWSAGSGFSSYSWSTGAITSNISVSTAGTYTVTVSIGSCTASATKSLTVNANPNTTITGNSAKCANDGPVTFDAGSGFNTYLWSSGANTQTIQVSVAGTYTVTVSNALGCTFSTTKLLTVNANPSTSISGPTTICSSDGVVTYDAGGGFSSYLWSTGSVNQTIQASVAGTYTVTVSNASGCTGTAAKTLVVNSNPSTTITGSDSICAGTSVTWDAGSGFNSYLWSTGSNNQTINISVAGTYTVTVSNGVNCTATAAQKLTINSLPVANAGTNSTICSGTNVQIGSPGVFGNTYLWSPPTDLSSSTDPQPQVDNFTNVTSDTISRTYTLVVTNTFSCTKTSSVTIVVIPIPVIQATSDATVCEGVAFGVNFNCSVVNPVYNWTNSNTNINLGASGTGSISFTPVNSTNAPIFGIITVTPEITRNNVTCTGNSDTFIDTINPRPIIVGTPDTTICEGVSFSVEPFQSDVLNTFFSWSNTNPNINLNGSGSGNITYLPNNNTNAPIFGIITVTPQFTNNNVTCIGIVDAFTDTVNPSPIIASTVDTTICEGVSFSVSPFQSDVLNTVFNWSNSNPNINLNGSGSGNITYVPNNNTNAPIFGIITVTPQFTNNNVTCIGTVDVFTDTVNPRPIIQATGDSTICEGVPLAVPPFQSDVLNTVFNWTNSNNNINLGASGSGNISFTPNNSSSGPVFSNIIVTPQFTNNSVTCIGIADSFNDTINPRPVIQPTGDTTICNGVQLVHPNFISDVTNTVFNWTSSNPNIGLAATGSGNIVFNGTNNGSVPIFSNIIVTPEFTHNNVTCTGSTNSFNDTVNPLPLMLSSADTTICSGQILNYNIISSFTNNVTYQWLSAGVTNVNGNSPTNPDTTVAIIPDLLTNQTNNTIINVPYNFTLTFNDVNKNCASDSVLNVTLNPAPDKPIVSELPFGTSLNPLTLCGGSDNISFNITNLTDSVHWVANPANEIHIGNESQNNAVISFNNGASNYTATITAINYNTVALGRCADSVLLQVNVNTVSDTIKEQKIIHKNPGNLLIYLDNSVDSYQWGFDTVGTLRPFNVAGQVFQSFIPSAKFVKDSAGISVLDIVHYNYWVMVRKGSCRTKVYYNGPYAKKLIEDPLPVSSEIVMQILPNPNNGTFTFQLSGDVFGKINASVMNTIGQEVFNFSFEKTSALQQYNLSLNEVQSGIYILKISDEKNNAAKTKLIIK